MIGKYFRSRKEAFEKIYSDNYWGTEVKSGSGSTIAATENIRNIIPEIVNKYNIKSIVDVACGDLTWMPLVLEKLGDIKYTGCDIVESLIEEHKKKYPQYKFQTLDIVEENIPSGELIICREVLQHLPVRDIQKALINFSNSSAKYILATIRHYYIRMFLCLLLSR
jgi:2-polyprenyl-3-methyl-5-hydroxy-6-metoxy-1,4-benzoquinol methylase